MINDHQVKKLRMDLNGGMTLAKAAVGSGMSEKTARKYRTMKQLPSEAKRVDEIENRRETREVLFL